MESRSHFINLTKSRFALAYPLTKNTFLLESHTKPLFDNFRASCYNSADVDPSVLNPENFIISKLDLSPSWNTSSHPFDFVQNLKIGLCFSLYIEVLDQSFDTLAT